MKLKQGIGCVLGGMARVILEFLGAGIHVWSIVIAYKLKGLLAALLTLCLPVLSQGYWFLNIWSRVGTVWNVYCISILAYLIVCVVFLIGCRLAESEE